MRWSPYPFTDKQLQAKGLKLHLGPNSTYLNDFLNVDIDPNNKVADVIGDAANLSMFRDNTISLILSSHIIEHWSFTSANRAIQEWYRVLKPGGWLIMELPDMDKCMPMYMNATSEQEKTDAAIGIWGRGDWNEFQAHKWGYTFTTLGAKLHQAGFRDITLKQPLPNHAFHRSMRIDSIK